MRDVVTEATRKRGVFFKTFTVVVVICILCSQLFVVWKIQDKYRKGGAKGKEGSVGPGNAATSLYKSIKKPTNAPKPKEETDDLPRSISQVLKRLPEPKLDEFAFESDVVGPQQDMLEKFPAHPGLVINKLNKVIEKEEKRSESIAAAIEEVRNEFGLEARPNPASEAVAEAGMPAAAAAGIGKRRLSAVQYEPGLPPCPQTSPHLLGPLVVRSELTERERNLAPGSDEWRRWYGPVKTGGSYSPGDCQPRQKVAIIVPFRDRKEHLQLFLRHMHPVLQRQQLDYRIFVVEQAGDEAFNRAALMNVGYAEASRRGAFDCFVFHDVDLVPEDDRSVYSCPKDTPKHLAVAVNKWKYRLIYGDYFGGVTALTKEQFEDVNGFSNGFYGWGGEDDDLFHRVTKKGYSVFRYPGNIGRYSMLKHDKVDQNEDLDSMMEKSKKDLLTDDGLTTLQYKKLNEKLLPTHTWLLVKLPPPPPKKQPSAWDSVKSQLWSGMEAVGGGVAHSISDHANHVAMRKQRQHEQSVDHLY